MFNKSSIGCASLAALGLFISVPHDAAAQETSNGPLTYEIAYTADVTGPVSGAKSAAGRFLDNLDVIADLDLERAGWRGARLHAYVLNNSGGQPNDLVGSLEGVDNIEVNRPRTRLYELWLEQSFGGLASLKAGLYDLNSEFYVTNAAEYFISPPFGIGSEFASTGPNGPSIFPSTTLAARLRFGAEEGPYAQAALLNADVSTLGDPKGVRLGLDQGALAVAEAGFNGATRIAAGTWRYTERQEDIRELTAAGDPMRRRAAGAYVVAEHAFTGRDASPAVRAFVRAGISDGNTSPFRGGWQAGVLVERVFASREDSVFSIGVAQGLLSRKYRANGADAGQDLGRAESRVEITYSDRLTRRLSVQPDLQYIWRPNGDREAKNAVVAALRLTVDLH